MSLEEIGNAKGAFLGIAQAIEQGLQTDENGYKAFREIAKEEIAKMARKDPEDPYILRLDGFDASSLEDIDRARKTIEAIWTGSIIDVAYDKMVQMLKKEILKSEDSMTPKFLKESTLTSYITVVHHSAEGKNTVLKGTTSGLPKMKKGDVVMLIPDLVTALYANVNSEAKKGKLGRDKPAVYSSRAFMARAAANIRRAVHLKKGQGSLRVFAGRSRSAFPYVAAARATRRDGTTIDPLPEKTKSWMVSAWAIIFVFSKKGTLHRAAQ